MVLAPSEEKMWEKSRSKDPANPMTDEQINDKYERGEQRILIEMNREKLPSFAESLKKPRYMDTQPFYQRRPRWDKKTQSRLIESFLINLPVPPILLYEKNYNFYEVIDGQQRITAIRDFYENKLELSDLDLWPELNGKTYRQLPAKIRAGIDRRSISSIVLITESTPKPEDALYLTQLAFERLNTGGIDLSNQEVRNCLYYGKFNELLLDLSKYSIFAKAWKIPIDNPENLLKNNLYKKMEDAELILRFFALRHVDNFSGGIKEFLDSYMVKSLNFSDQDIQILRNDFVNTIDLAYEIYEEKLFKPYDSTKQSWKEKAYKDYYDAVMVGLSRHLDERDLLIDKKAQVLEDTKKLLIADNRMIFTGRGRTKSDIQNRIELFDKMLSQVIAE
jgi:hypothetical protein